MSSTPLRIYHGPPDDIVGVSTETGPSRKTVTVPLAKSRQSHAKIALVELAGGRWKAVVADTGMDVGDFWNSGSPLTVRDKKTFPSRAAAIGVMADRLIEMWTKQLKRTSGYMVARERTRGVLADLRTFHSRVAMTAETQRCLWCRGQRSKRTRRC